MSAGKVIGRIISLPFKIVIGVGKVAIRVLDSAASVSQRKQTDFTNVVVRYAEKSDEELDRIRNSKFSTDIEKTAAMYVLKNGSTVNSKKDN